MMKLDRDKYIGILRSEGLHNAITALHRDMERIENETFEGRDGYNPEMVTYLSELREFSRQLWKTSLEEDLKDQSKGA